MSTCKNYHSLFDICLQDERVTDLKEVTTIQEQSQIDSIKEPIGHCANDDRQREISLSRKVPDRMVCSTCQCSFNNREEQTEHYKIDWHRFNLRQKIIGLSTVTVEEFERKTGSGDMSSISGSDSNSGEEDSESDMTGKSTDISCSITGSYDLNSVPSRKSSKVVFQNSQGQYLAVFRCVFQDKFDGDEDMVASLKTISTKTLWVILMTGGGHFAGAVFQGNEVLQHKTFHRYTVRAKRGTAQGLRDAQNRSHAPKSAGAALRRHNEAALVKEIQDLMDSWAQHLKEASVIFLRAPSYNKTIFFGGREAPLERSDGRIRTIPFATRRATFREVQRVHNLLSTVHIHEKDTELCTILSPSKKVWKKAPTSTESSSPKQEHVEEDNSSSEDKQEGETVLETVEMTLGTLDLREYEIEPSRRKRKRRRKEGYKKQIEVKDVQEAHPKEVNEPAMMPETGKPTQEKPTKNNVKNVQMINQVEGEDDYDDSWEYGVRDALYTACKIGDVDFLCSLLQIPATATESPEPCDPPAASLSPVDLLNKPIDSAGFTLLHVASAAAQKVVVKLLMDAGSNPACRDNKGQTPYTVAPDKETRNVFRKYMAENPEMYDYSKAQVPGPLTAEVELKKTEKKKAQKAAKKQREREQKEEKKKLEHEAEEKRRFISLSDREKRALAAEKRLAEQKAAMGVGISNVERCWLCGESLLGKIPFSYSDYSFCSPRCVQAHRKANAISVKT